MSAKKTEDRFLSRWSRRKLEGKAPPEPEAEEGADKSPAGDEAKAPAAAPGGPAEAGREGEGAEDAPPELTEEDVAKLGPGADYTVYMKKGVSAHVQRLALRKLWLSNPVLANLDGLVDYGEDFGAAADAGKEVVTAWRFGKGFAGKDDAPAAAASEDGTDAVPEAGTEAVPTGETEEGEEAASEPAPDDGDDAEKA